MRPLAYIEPAGVSLSVGLPAEQPSSTIFLRTAPVNHSLARSGGPLVLISPSSHFPEIASRVLLSLPLSFSNCPYQRVGPTNITLIQKPKPFRSLVLNLGSFFAKIGQLDPPFVLIFRCSVAFPTLRNPSLPHVNLVW
jgi:hypothetical protein